MRYHTLQEVAMADILIRGLEETAVSRLDELASQKGVSRNSLITSILRDAARTPVSMERAETLRVLELVSDLGDSDVMDGAWR